MNIIEKTRELVAAFPGLDKLSAGVHIDLTDPQPQSVGLAPLGDTLLGSDVTGTVQQRQHTFMLYCVYSAINDFERIANSGVLLELALWLESRGGQIEQEIGGVHYTGEITAITTANGRIFDIPQNSFSAAVRYQLQLIVQYTLEED